VGDNHLVCDSELGCLEGLLEGSNDRIAEALVEGAVLGGVLGSVQGRPHKLVEGTVDGFLLSVDWSGGLELMTASMRGPNLVDLKEPLRLIVPGLDALEPHLV